MTTQRTIMVNKATSKIGLEDEWVIAFVRVCEVYPNTEEVDEMLATLLKCKLEHLCEEDEE